MYISTNIPAAKAHKNLNGAGRKNSVSSERLSTGLRINSAADDAAGLSISKKMKAQIRGLRQAQRNSEDGTNLLETMDGAMGIIQEMMIRQRELIIQALNGTNTDDDRIKIQSEIDQLTAEIAGTAEKTKFNNIPLLSPPSESSNSSRMLSAAVAPLAAASPPTPTETINFNTLTGTMSGAGWNFTGGVLTITGSGVFQINGTGVQTANRITVQSGLAADVILNNVNINTTTGAALDVRGATVDLWLEGTNWLETNNSLNAGVQTTGGTLTIDGAGSMTAIYSGGVPSNAGAGIGGGGTNNDGGNIIINGGTLEYTGHIVTVMELEIDKNGEKMGKIPMNNKYQNNRENRICF